MDIFPKPWYASKSIWANLLQAILGVAVASGTISTGVADSLSGWADQILGTAIAVLSGFSIWGRVIAVKPIDIEATGMKNNWPETIVVKPLPAAVAAEAKKPSSTSPMGPRA